MWTAFSSCASAEDLQAALADLSLAELERLERDWQLWSREEQLAPPADAVVGGWRTWLMLGGRGAGKTRAGAEWVRHLVHRQARTRPGEPLRIALVGETMREARSVMVDGVSGIMSVHEQAGRPVFEVSRQQLVWPTGSIAQLFSAEDPDGLRGPQFHAAWCDELAKWMYAEETWDMLQFALRLGERPCAIATTTPRPVPLLRRLIGDPATVTTRMRTADNADHLAPSFLAEIERRYAGTLLGRQELEGELIEDVAGALWRHDWIEAVRREVYPELVRIVVAVDPPVTATAASDACGIVVAGLGEDRRGYVLADLTLKGREPHVWARAAIAAYKEYNADRIVAEVNQGGDLVVGVLKQIDAGVPVSKVRATRGKWLRAEPVAALYAEGRVSHVGTFRELEGQMLTYGTNARGQARSPDRLDALVWALTELLLEPAPLPSMRMI